MRYSVYRRVSLSSTPQINTRTTPFQPPKSVSSTRQMHRFNTKNRQFNTPVSSTHKKRQLDTKKRLFNTKKRQFNTPASLTQKLFFIGFFFVLNWRFFVLNCRVCWTESFWCWTDGFLCWADGCVELTIFYVELTGVLNWRFLSVKLTHLCWTETFHVLNWQIL